MKAPTLALLTMLILAPASSALAQDQLAAAQAAAKAGAESPEGKKFQEAVEQVFARDHSKSIQECAMNAKQADLASFDLLLQVDASGVVARALATPATGLAECVRDKMPSWKISPPPAADFWIEVAVTLRGKSK